MIKSNIGKNSKFCFYYTAIKTKVFVIYFGYFLETSKIILMVANAQICLS